MEQYFACTEDSRFASTFTMKQRVPRWNKALLDTDEMGSFKDMVASSMVPRLKSFVDVAVLQAPKPSRGI